MLERDGYPSGVPCWIDVVQPDFDRTVAFYGALFDWTFENRTPADAPFRYAYARRDGLVVAGVGGSATIDAELSDWSHYVRVESADASVDAVVGNGGQVLSAPVDIPHSGRVAMCVDPHGARIGLWQPAELLGAQLVNAPGSWNFSELHTPQPDESIAFYGAVFGWVCDRFDLGPDDTAWLWRVPGYGAFLAERDPEMADRQADAQAPDGFADAVAWMEPFTPGAAAGARAHWSITFAVADADAAFARAIDLGASVVTSPVRHPVHPPRGRSRPARRRTDAQRVPATRGLTAARRPPIEVWIDRGERLHRRVLGPASRSVGRRVRGGRGGQPHPAARDRLRTRRIRVTGTVDGGFTAR
jgi:predicted enzyme related to lactoylglutathione lyase